MRLFSDKKTRKRNLLFVLCPIIILMIIFGVLTVTNVLKILNSSNDNAVVKDEYKIEKYGYILRDNATDYQKELFKELKDMIEGNEEIIKEDMASLVAKNFIADYYTWSNKNGQYDVGGMSFFYEDRRDNLLLQSRDNFYKYVSNYLEEYNRDQLLEVESVEVLGCSYMGLKEFNGINYPWYSVYLEWKYKDCELLRKYDFTTKQFLSIVLEDDGKMEIVEVYE